MRKVDTASPCIVKVLLVCTVDPNLHPNPVKILFFAYHAKLFYWKIYITLCRQNLQILGIVPISIILILVHPRVNSDDENVKKDFADFSKESI